MFKSNNPGGTTTPAAMQHLSLAVSAAVKTYAAASVAAFATVAHAQGGAEISDSHRVIEQVIVTARKREETLQDSPVLINGFNQMQIEQYRINSVDELAMFTPGLQASERTGSAGGSLYLRGIGTGETGFLSESSIAINIDGMQVGSLNIRKVSQIDMEQIEVLRGPQALFFGKNSPGGVVSIKTADPGDELEVSSSVGYEAVSRDRYVQAIVSGPVTDTVGVRVLGRYTDVDGYFNLKTVDGGGNPLVVAPSVDKWPDGEETFARATVTYDPSDRLAIRAKAHYSKSDISAGSATGIQRFECPQGAPQGQVPFPCRKGRDIYLGGAPADLVNLSPDAVTDDGLGLRENTQYLGTLDAEFDVTPELQFTSVTGYWNIDEINAQNASMGPMATVLVPHASFEMSQLTQEFRLASDFDSAVNFTVGTFAEWRDSESSANAVITLFPLAFPLEAVDEDQHALSVFGQVEVDLNEAWTLSGGARYSYEEKSVTYDYNGTDVTDNLTRPDDHWENLSPEVTLTYQPTDELTLFASWKEGFKSGGVDPGFTNGAIAAGPGYANGFDEETVSGFELGAKGMYLDGSLAVNLAAYSYEYQDLQVSSPEGESTTTIRFRTRNAASADVRGVEFDFTWLPGLLPGVTLQGAFAYNDAEYNEYLSECYTGQSILAGCNLSPLASGAFSQQDLSGRPLGNAPPWSGSLNIGYEQPLFGNLLFNGSLGVSYTDNYWSNTELAPADERDAFTKLNASLRIGSMDGRWDVSLVGRNLTDEYTYTITAPAVLSGSGTGTNAAVLPDLTGFPSRGRELFMQFTYRWK